MTRAAYSKIVQWGVWGALIGVIVIIGALFARERLTRSPLPVVSVVRDFALTNQAGATVTLADLRGKVWVADIVFSRCPGPCRRMTKDMARLEQLFPKDAPVRFVSLTSDPEYDSPAILKRFGAAANANFERWDFLTGPKKSIIDLAVNDLKLVRVEKSEKEREVENDLFIHSTTFVIVDKRGQLRAWVESDDPDALTKARNLVDQLIREH
jgi:protein SCO1/2